MGNIAVRLAGPGDMGAVRQLCRDYRTLLAKRNGGRSNIVESYYSSDSYDDLLNRIPDLHARPDGAIFVGLVAGTITGCGMTHRIDDTTCEIKRVFVDEAARGHGLAIAIFEAAMRQAAEDGYRRMVLDTMRVLPEAIGLYHRLGFAECEPFYEVDPAYVDEILFFGKDL